MNFPISIGRTSLFQIVGVLVVFFIGIQFSIERYTASDLGLRCLPMSNKKDARLTCIYLTIFISRYL